MELARLAAGALHHPAEPAPPVRRAAGELARYLGRMTGRTPTLVAAPGPPGAWLRLGDGALPQVPPDAEAVARAGAGGVSITAASPRALLAAVYAFLEAAGCRWSPWGEADEHVPVGPAVRDVPQEVVLAPPFARRAWAADLATWHYAMPERLAARLPGDVAFVDWMAKTGATGFLFIRHANDTQWVVPELLPELAARGLALEPGGHGLVELLPRALFTTHPEYFPVGPDGARTDFGNVCASSRAALDLIATGAQATCDELGTPDFHLWPLDLFGGGWCRCDACATRTPSEQALLIANAAAERIPGRVWHLAYHDTIDVPRSVRPHARVWAEFAPRERCYGHPIDDPTCTTNARYHAALVRHLDVFEGRVDVFEYYADAILFGGCTVPLTAVIEADLAAYRRIGVRGVSCLTFGRFSTWAYGANIETFAHAACGHARPASPPSHVIELERLMSTVVRYGDILLPPKGDDAVRRALDTAVADLRALESRAPHSAAERHLLDYNATILTALRDYVDAAVPSATEAALDALARAPERLRPVPPEFTGTWGTHDLEMTLHYFLSTLRSRA